MYLLQPMLWNYLQTFEMREQLLDHTTVLVRSRRIMSKRWQQPSIEGNKGHNSKMTGVMSNGEVLGKSYLHVVHPQRRDFLPVFCL